MNIRHLNILLASLLFLLQYPLWISNRSGYLYGSYLTDQIKLHEKENSILRARNETVDAEVVSLKNNQDAIEERARNDLGMIKKNEQFVLLIPSD